MVWQGAEEEFAAALIGGLAMFVYTYIYVLTDLREDSVRLDGPPVPTFDTIVFLDALGLSILFVPIGACAGLLVLFILSVLWKMSRQTFFKSGSR